MANESGKQTQEQLWRENQSLKQRVTELAGQLRDQAAQLTIAQQQERTRVARQLDDQLQQLLAEGRFVAGATGAQTHDDNLYRYLRRVDALLDQSVDPLQSLAAQLYPPVVCHGSLGQIMRWLAGWMQDKHGLSVQVNVDDQADMRSEEIRTMLFVVVRELLFNVLKHADTRQATVTLVPGAEHVQIVVADDGLGFEPAVLSSTGGLAEGAGLRCIRERLQELGGSLEVHSAAGEGTLVIVQAPVHAAARPGKQEPPVPVDGSAEVWLPDEHMETSDQGPKIRVLLADDHAVVRDGLRRLLQMQPDIEVIAQAADGLEAVDLALQLRPDVIVLDANMPRLNGIQAARRILANLPEARIIGLSMYTAADMDLAMRQAGACDYLTKTSSPENVVAAVRTSVVGRAGRG